MEAAAIAIANRLDDAKNERIKKQEEEMAAKDRDIAALSAALKQANDLACALSLDIAGLEVRIAELETERDSAASELAEARRRIEMLEAALREYLDEHDAPSSNYESYVYRTMCREKLRKLVSKAELVKD